MLKLKQFFKIFMKKNENVSPSFFPNKKLNIDEDKERMIQIKKKIET